MTKIQAHSLKSTPSPQRSNAIKKKGKIENSHKTTNATKKAVHQTKEIEEQLTEAIHLIKGHSVTTYVDESIIRQITNDAKSIEKLDKMLKAQQRHN